MSSLQFAVEEQSHVTESSRIYEAVDPSGRRYLIEVLATPGIGAWLEAFRQDMVVLGELAHPGILPVVDIGARPDGTPVIATERPPGISLGGFLREGRRLPAGTALEWLAAIAGALDAAHAAGVSHGSLCVDDVILAEAPGAPGFDLGQPRLRGFGHRWLRAAVAYGAAPSMAPPPAGRSVPAPRREILADIAALAELAERLLAPLDDARLTAVIRSGRVSSGCFDSASGFMRAVAEVVTDPDTDLTDPCAPLPSRIRRRAVRRVVLTAALTIFALVCTHAIMSGWVPAPIAHAPGATTPATRPRITPLSPLSLSSAAPISADTARPRATRAAARPRPRLFRVWSESANQVVLVDGRGKPANP